MCNASYQLVHCPLAAMWWDAQSVRWGVWGGLIVLTIALLLLVRTRWGQSQPLGKCIVLSLLAHLLLGIYTTTVDIVTATVDSPGGKGVQVALVDGTGESQTVAEPWDALESDSSEAFAAPDLSPVVAAPPPVLTAEPERSQPVDPLPAEATKLPDVPPAEDAGPPAFEPRLEPIARPATFKGALPSEAPSLPSEDTGQLAPIPPPLDPMPTASNEPPGGGEGTNPVENPSSNPTQTANNGKPADGGSASGGNDVSGPAAGPSPPRAFQQRLGDHLQVGAAHGATKESEAAVTAALRWLAKNQISSGRWPAGRLGGGAGRAMDGQERQAAGAGADAGITGLALLAFLASGNTHLQGEHKTTVRRGLEFLLNGQDANGFLGATTNQYERMYCHAMAMCALSEALAMTGDERLRPAVRRAIEYTIASQDRVGGGWRYQPGDSGDTSQLGWQVMAIKSAEMAGISIPPETREGIRRFLKSVSLGRSGGLACYQPSRAITSRSMTAEALVCRQFMGYADTPEAIAEASGYVLGELPGSGLTNHYYWYYATLAMYGVQGDAWQRWNEALQRSLLATQRLDGELAGSWDPDPVWGGCGGRAYSTALSTLCLEVYYRFLPLYIEAAGRDRRAK